MNRPDRANAVPEWAKEFVDLAPADCNVFVRTRDVVIFCSALIVVCLIAGHRLEQHVRSEQLANMVRASYAVDRVKAETEKAQAEKEKLEKMLPVVQSIYDYKNTVAKNEQNSGDG